MAITDPSDMTRNFYIVAQEPGRETAALPTWGAHGADNIHFTEPPPEPWRQNLDGVVGGFILHDILSHDECDQFVAITEQLGYHEDSPVSLSHEIRHNHNLNWIVDEAIDGTIWSRCGHLIEEEIDGYNAIGLNARFRFYRYAAGDFFKPHTDGAWPGSRIINSEMIYDAYGDRFSQFTFLIFLSDGYQGGRTLFYTNNNPRETPVAVSTPKGAALCFPHGYHPQHCIHAGEQIIEGTKYIFRTDVLYPF